MGIAALVHGAGEGKDIKKKAKKAAAAAALTAVPITELERQLEIEKGKTAKANDQLKEIKTLRRERMTADDAIDDRFHPLPGLIPTNTGHPPVDANFSTDPNVRRVVRNPSYGYRPSHQYRQSPSYQYRQTPSYDYDY